MLIHVLASVDANAITISDYGVREGLVTDYVASHAREISELGGVGDLRLRSVLHCLEQVPAGDQASAFMSPVSRSSCSTGCNRFIGSSANDRELLHFAALLHDVGSVIGHDRHTEHAYYIIKNANLRGLTAAELELIANVARYHGKARPRKRDKNFRALAPSERRTVRWLAAMLRIAEGLDRSQYQLIRSLRVSKRGGHASILVTPASARDEAQLEVWAAKLRIDLLESMIGAPVRLAAQRSRDSGPRKLQASAAKKRSTHPSRAKRAAKRLRVVRLPVVARSGA